MEDDDANANAITLRTNIEEVSAALMEELDRRLKKSAERQKLPCSVGISMGYAVCDGKGTRSIEEQIELADRQMYENKRNRQICPSR